MTRECPFCGKETGSLCEHLENQHDGRALSTGEQSEIGDPEKA